MKPAATLALVFALSLPLSPVALAGEAQIKPVDVTKSAQNANMGTIVPLAGGLLAAGGIIAAIALSGGGSGTTSTPSTP